MRDKNNGNYSICLLDWGYASLFPRFFELATALCTNDRDRSYNRCLVETITGVTRPTEDERNCVNLLMRTRAGTLRYTL